MKAKTETPAIYNGATSDEDATIARALEILESRIRKVEGNGITASRDVVQYLKARLMTRDAEQFFVLYLDTRYRVIEARPEFNGGLTLVNVHIREIARQALLLNAHAVIVAHNHPSGHLEPSTADINLTHRLHEALKLIEIRLLDHVLIAHAGAYSFAANGRMPG